MMMYKVGRRTVDKGVGGSKMMMYKVGGRWMVRKIKKVDSLFKIVLIWIWLSRKRSK